MARRSGSWFTLDGVHYQPSLDVVHAVMTRWPRVAALWGSCVGAELDRLCRQYRATVAEVLPSRYGFVVAVDAGGAALVMRATPDPHGVHQAGVMVALARLGVGPTVHEVLPTATGVWVVMDRVRPGTALADAVGHPRLVTAIVEMLRPLVLK